MTTSLTQRDRACRRSRRRFATRSTSRAVNVSGHSRPTPAIEADPATNDLRFKLGVAAMSLQAELTRTELERALIPGTSLRVSRAALGTWAIGGWMWGGTDEAKSIATIHAALEHGINLIDTAPVYGFGQSEEIVGKAIAAAQVRSHVIIATKTGLEWRDGKPFRNASRERILHEIGDSLRRLRTDYIDIYQVHWPDPQVPIEETADTMRTLLRERKICAIGVSNFSVEQIERFR